MRKPTPLDVQLRWWRAAIGGEKPSVHADFPEAGFFKVRLRYMGPYVPASIEIEQDIDFETGELLTDEKFIGKIGAEICPLYRIWPWAAKRPIQMDEYRWLMASMPFQKP